MGKRKLGRGLEMLIPRAESVQQGHEIRYLHPQEIRENPEQPRKEFSIAELEGLKTSISRDGVLQPLLVRRAGDEYELVAGERRLRAARELALEKVPVILVDVPDDRILEMALIENIHREDLNPIELAEAFRRLVDLKSWTQDTLAEELGISRPTVANTLRLLDLPEDMQKAVVRGQITMGHAKVLLSVGDEKVRRALFEKIAEEKLSVRDTELTRDEQLPDAAGPAEGPGTRRPPGGKGRKNPNIVRLEEELMEALGTRVTIRLRGTQGDRGVLALAFHSREEFDHLRSLLLRKRET